MTATIEWIGSLIHTLGPLSVMTSIFSILHETLFVPNRDHKGSNQKPPPDHSEHQMATTFPTDFVFTSIHQTKDVRMGPHADFNTNAPDVQEDIQSTSPV